MSLRPYQQRVVDERAELDSRRSRLEQYISTPGFNERDNAEQKRMVRQLLAMGVYSDMLRERIEAFGT